MTPRDGLAWQRGAAPAAASRLAVAGVWEEDGELWSPGGELLVQSRQLALVREPEG